jgi:hypothetical protein
MRVVTVGEHGAAATARAVEQARRGNLEGLHAAREPDAIARLDDEVDVIALDREVDDAERFGPVRRGERGPAKRAVHRGRAKGGDLARDADRDVHRRARGQERSRLVAFARAGSSGWPTGPRSGTHRGCTGGRAPLEQIRDGSSRAFAGSASSPTSAHDNSAILISPNFAMTTSNVQLAPAKI